MSYVLIKHIVGIHYKPLSEALQMSAHNIYFCVEKTKIQISYQIEKKITSHVDKYFLLIPSPS